MSTPKFNNDNVTEVLYMASMDAIEVYSLEDWGDSASLIDSPLTNEEIDRILQECDITITDEERAQLTTMAGAIVYSDSQGSVSYDGFVTNDALFGHWANIESDYYPDEDEDEDLFEDEDEDEDEDKDEEPEVDYKDAEAVSLKEFVWLAVQNGLYSEICQNSRKPDTYPVAYKVANPYTRETIYKKVLLESQYMKDEDVKVLADNMLGLVYIQYNDHSVVNVAYLDGELENYWAEAVKLVIQSYQS